VLDGKRKGFLTLADWTSGFQKIGSKNPLGSAEFIFAVLDTSDNYTVSPQEIRNFFEHFLDFYFTVAEGVFLLQRRNLPHSAPTAELDKAILNCKKRRIAASEVASEELVALRLSIRSFEDPLPLSIWIKHVSDTGLHEMAMLLLDILRSISASPEQGHKGLAFSQDQCEIMHEEAGLKHLERLRKHHDMKSALGMPELALEPACGENLSVLAPAKKGVNSSLIVRFGTVVNPDKNPSARVKFTAETEGLQMAACNPIPNAPDSEKTNQISQQQRFTRELSLASSYVRVAHADPSLTSPMQQWSSEAVQSDLFKATSKHPSVLSVAQQYALLKPAPITRQHQLPKVNSAAQRIKGYCA